MRNLVPVSICYLLALLHPAVATAQDSLTIGYFNEWPLPAHYGQSSGAFDEVLGAPTIWKPFDSSLKMFAALETGDIQIAVSPGIAPFLFVVNDGLDFDIVDIAVSYADNENCFVHNSIGFSAETPSALVGKTAALPMGTQTHFNFLKQLEILKVNPASVEIVNMAPSGAASAFVQQKVEVACGWGAALETMKNIGSTLTTGDEKVSNGGGNFDVIAIRASFGADNPEVVAKFLQINNGLNTNYTANPSRMIADIAAPLKMTEEAVKASMADFRFYSIAEKTGENWLNGGTQTYLKSLADFFATQGTINRALDSYADYIDPNYLQSAAALPLVAAE